jgi:hypothetical protein
MAVVHRWYRTNPDLTKLTERIIKSGGVWAVARLRTEQIEHQRVISLPPSTGSAPKMITVEIKRPDSPKLIVVMPDGSHRVLPMKLAAELLGKLGLLQ